ncbi:MAG: bifunctional lysine ketoglutarate reductase /saccharopine dehydrogenase family protein [Thermoanaerobaculia bacterium]
MNVIGIRKEDKNRWERRAPLTPDHVAELTRMQKVEVIVQPSSRRAFHDLDYERSSARLSLDLGDADIVLGVKEVPPERVLERKVYVIFPHVTKGQDSTMPMLQRLMEKRCTLIDYELITDRRGRRLIFFGRHAGYAGMIDTLWALGRRLAHEGFDTPFEQIRMAHAYSSLDEALRDIARAGERIRHEGLPVGLRPVVFAFTGSGNVTQGALEVFDRLPFSRIEPEQLRSLPEDRDRPRNLVYKTVLDRSHRFERREGGGFDPEELARRPDLYRSAIAPLLPHITVLVNGVFWDPAQPRLVTKDDIRRHWAEEKQPKLRVIGDITCDIGGSIEVTVKPTEPGDPIYVWEPATDEIRMGTAGAGPVVLAVDNLPCELPIEASQHFGDSLLGFVPALARCDWTRDFENLDLPPEIHRAIIVHQGELTPPYRFLATSLEAARAGTRS